MRIHKEGFTTIVLVTVIVAVIITSLILFTSNSLVLTIAIVVGGLAVFQSFSFFRVPKRDILLDDYGVVAPADGKVVMIEEITVNEYIQEKRLQISIFMNLFNVHVNWYPIGGTIMYYKYHPGDKMVAWHPKSSEKNEHTTIFIGKGKKMIGVRQIAGFVARRIVCTARQTKMVQQCSEVGIIKFGSRVDILLPLDVDVKVSVGQKVRGCETLLAQFRANPS